MWDLFLFTSVSVHKYILYISSTNLCFYSDVEKVFGPVLNFLFVMLICFKQIRILCKDNMQFFKWWFHLLKAQCYPDLPDPVWNSHCPLNLIIGCVTLLLLLFRLLLSIFFVVLFYFSHTGGHSSMNSLYKFMPQHLRWILIQTLVTGNT